MSLEYCSECDEATGNAGIGEDSLHCDGKVYCDVCWELLPHNQAETIARQKAKIDELTACIEEMCEHPGSEYEFGLRCGVEDRDIMCRYEAAEYGYAEAFEYIGSIAANVLPPKEG